MARLLSIVVRSLPAMVAPVLVAGCAGAPTERVEVSGGLPPAATVMLVAPDSSQAVTGSPAAVAALACLASAGLESGQPGNVLVQVGHAVRPARARVVPGATATEQPRHQPGAKRDQEELTVALSDRSSGALLWRGAVFRPLRRSEQPGDGTALLTPLCQALRSGPAAASR